MIELRNFVAEHPGASGFQAKDKPYLKAASFVTGSLFFLHALKHQPLSRRVHNSEDKGSQNLSNFKIK